MPDTNFKTIVVSDGQSIVDLAMQNYGTIAGVFLLIEDNESLNTVDQVPVAGELINVRILPSTISVKSRTVARQLNTAGIVINTGNVVDAIEGYVEGGYVDGDYVE